MTSTGSEGEALQLALPLFQGSIEDLVKLVSERKVMATEVPVAEVAAQLCAYLEACSNELEEVGELLLQAAYLAAAKSNGVLAVPAFDDADEVGERQMGPVSAAIEMGQWLRGNQWRESFAGDGQLLTVEPKLEPRPIDDVRTAWLGMLERQEHEPAKVAVPTFIRVEVAISRLISRLRSSARLSFRRLMRGANRNDAVVHFLAVLELVRSRRAA